MSGSIDLQRMIDTATSFFLAAERCAPDLAFGKYGSHSVNAPRIVNYAFSVELTLKLLHQLISARGASGHSLNKLFNNLPLDTQSKLPHLSMCVDEIDQYFEHWRYPFEKDLLFGETGNPRRAFIECYREIRILKPGLMSIYEENWGSFEPDWDWAWTEFEIAQIEQRLGS